MANPKYDETTEFFLIAGKLNNRQKPVRLGKMALKGDTLASLVLADNVDFDNNGETTQRLGRESVYAGDPHSFWTKHTDDQTAYFVEDGVLKKLNLDFSATNVATLSTNNPLVYELVNDEIVITNGVDIGWLRGTEYTPFSQTPGQFERQTVAGQYLVFYRGVLYVARDNILFASKPWNIEVMDERLCQFPMEGHIRMLASVTDGLWIATEKNLGYIAGKAIDEFEYSFMTDVVPPDGAFTREIEDRNGELVNIVTWASEEGFCQGEDHGQYKNVSGTEIALPKAASGKVFRQFNNGIRQYIAVLYGPDYTRTYTAPDLSTTERTI